MNKIAIDISGWLFPTYNIPFFRFQMIWNSNPWQRMNYRCFRKVIDSKEVRMIW